jgi:hypothetical protein
MRKAISFVAMFVSAILLPVLAHAVPEMSFETFKHDFGSVTAGEQLHYEFSFSNTGDEDLRITRLSPS